MVVGNVQKNAIPMYIGFDEDIVEMICTYLEESIERGNMAVSLFGEFDEE